MLSIVVGESQTRDAPVRRATSNPPDKISPNKLSLQHKKLTDILPYFFALLLLCGAGGFIQILRASSLAALTEHFSSGPPSAVYILAQKDLAVSLAKNGHYAEACKQYEHLIGKLTTAYGARDQRTIFAELSLASLNLEKGDETSAHNIWQNKLIMLAKPQSTAPRELTQLLLDLARQYEAYDYDVARRFYLLALNFWTHAPARDSISNAKSDLASVYWHLDNMVEANKYFLEAYSVTKGWGNTNYNVYRLSYIASSFNELGNFKEAEKYADLLLQMGEKVYPGDSYNGYALLMLGRAKCGLGKYAEAVPALERGLAMVSNRDPKYYYLSWGKYLLAQAYEQTRQFYKASTLYQNLLTELKPSDFGPPIEEIKTKYHTLTDQFASSPRRRFGY